MSDSSEDRSKIGALVVLGAAVGGLVIKAVSARARRNSTEYRGGYYQPPERRRSGLTPSDPKFYEEGWTSSAAES